jgi:energy-coupling factor transport system ATP-binding protein
MAIDLSSVNYTYGRGTVYEIHALKDINLHIGSHECIGIIGHTGSGKSTLMQHLNGLVTPTSGTITFHGINIQDEQFHLPDLRKKVGLVFQYPEYQLFEADVLSDVCFGPRNLGLPEEEVVKRAKDALVQVEIPKNLYEQSPLQLSGGQKRRVAIAGVLAMKPEILILDEPTAGLDPKGRDAILKLIRGLYEQGNMSVIFVSHSMEDVAKYVERLIVMDHGQIVYDDTPKHVFAHYKELEAIGLRAPQITYDMEQLEALGIGGKQVITTIEEAKEAVVEWFKA